MVGVLHSRTSWAFVLSFLVFRRLVHGCEQTVGVSWVLVGRTVAVNVIGKPVFRVGEEVGVHRLGIGLRLMARFARHNESGR